MKPIILFLLCCLLFARPSMAQDDPDDAVRKLEPVTPEIEKAAMRALDNCPPQGKTVRGGINKNGVYTLMGDLFDNGGIYAVIDLHVDDTYGNKPVLCHWKQNQWKVVSVIGVDVEWKYPGWNRQTTVGREPTSTKPFWMLTLKNRRLLAIASYEEKAGQNYYAVLFDEKCEHILDSAYSFGREPSVKYDRLITGDASRVKAEYEETSFSCIRENKFTLLATWSEYVPYNHPDDPNAPYLHLIAKDKFYEICDRNVQQNPQTTWIIFKENPGM